MIQPRKRMHARSGGKLRRRIMWYAFGLTMLVAIGVVVGKYMQGQEGRNVRVKQAALALQKGRPDLALRLISPVLAAQPNDLQARTMVIRARVKMSQFRHALSHVNQLVMLYPDRIDVRCVRVDVLLSVLDAQVSAPAAGAKVLALGTFETLFATVAADLDTVTSALDSHELQVIRVRMQSLKIRNLKRILAFNLADTDQQYEMLEQQLSADESKHESTLKQIVVQRPRQFDAWQMYLDVLASRDDIASLRRVASTLSDESQLPPAIASELIQHLVLVESGPEDLETRLALGQRLQAAVHPLDRADPRWIRTQATLGILSGKAKESLVLLDQLSQQQRYQPAVLLIRAKALSDLGRFPEVVSILQSLALKFPHIAAIQTPLGYTQAALGNLEDAARAFRASLTVIPKDAETVEGLANVLVRQGKVDEASEYVKLLVEKYPDRLSIISLQLQIAKSRQSEAEARALLKRLAQRLDQSEAMLMVLIDGYDYLKAHDQVEIFSKRLLDRNPSSIVARLGLAKSHISREEYGPALRLLKPMQVEVPDRTEISILIGRVQLARGRFELAADVLESVVDAQPTNGEAVVLLAQSLTGLHRLAEARTVLTEFSRRRPNDAQARFMSWQLDNMSVADAAPIEKSMATPGTSEALDVSSTVTMTRAMIAKGELGSAKMYALSAVEKNPQHVGARLLLAEVLMRMAQYETAVSQLRKLTMEHPTLIAPYHAIANLYVRSGQLEDGLQTANDLQGVNKPLATYLQGLLLLAMGRVAPAQASLEQALALAIQREDQVAIPIADRLASFYQRQGKDSEKAQVYTRLFDIERLATEARLHAIDQGDVADLTAQNTDQLELAAKTVQSDRKDLIATLMRRFDQAHQGEWVLTLLEKWIEGDQQNLHLLRAKAEILSSMGRSAQAVAAIVGALAIDQEDLPSWRAMVNLHIRGANYPAALLAIGRMGQLDEHAAIEAMLLSAAVYEQAGLSHRAASVAAKAVNQELPRDSNRLFRLGQLLERYDHNDRARECFEHVAQGSSLHVAAELEATKVIFDLGDIDAARVRLNDLLNTPKSAVQVAQYLLERSTPFAQQAAWLGECDQQLSIDLLPEALRNRWLMIRAQLALANRDWPGAVTVLSTLKKNGLSNPKLEATLAVLFAHLGQCSQAAAILSQLAQSEWMPYVCSETQVDGGATDLLALPHATSKFYAADIRDELRENPTQGATLKELYHRIGLAQLAMHVGLAIVAEDVAKGLYVAYGDSILTQSLMADAQLLQGKSAQGAIDTLIERFPKSSRASVELAQRQLGRQDIKAAKASLEYFLSREPTHAMGRYLQAKLHFAEGNSALGVAIMDTFDLTTGDEGARPTQDDSLTAAIANDFAFMLASYDESRLGDALTLARLAVSLVPQSAATLDTLGWISYLHGDQMEAGEYLYRAMSLAPTNITIHEHVAQWHQSQGQDQWAAYHREQISPNPTKIELSETYISSGKKAADVSDMVTKQIGQADEDAARRTLVATRP